MGLLLSLTACDRGSHPAQVFKPAPDFSIADDTDSVHLANYRGHIVLLNFWASWCAPCLIETPALIEFHKRHPEIDIIAVSIDEDEDAYRNFLTEHHVDFTTVRDPNQIVATKYQTTGWPETFIIDRQGLIRRRFVGVPDDWNGSEIDRFLKTL